MQAWEDMSRLDQLVSTYSDMHKETYGFRPVLDESWTEQDLENLLDDLEVQLKEAQEWEEVRAKQAIQDLEDRISDLMIHGARNRAMALRWLHEAMETNGEWDRLEWTLGVPFGYFKSKRDVV